VGNVGNEGGTCRDDGEWRVKQEGENEFVLEKSSVKGTDGDVAERKW